MSLLEFGDFVAGGAAAFALALLADVFAGIMWVFLASRHKIDGFIAEQVCDFLFEVSLPLVGGTWKWSS